MKKIIEEVLNIPSSPQDNTEFVSYAFSKSLIKADVSVTKDDRIVALSTCAYSSNDARFIVVAKLSVIEENIPD